MKTIIIFIIKQLVSLSMDLAMLIPRSQRDNVYVKILKEVDLKSTGKLYDHSSELYQLIEKIQN